MNYYKILSRDEKHYEMQYKTGLNIDIESFNPSGDCEKGGIYFADKDILAFLWKGCWLRKVTIPEGEKVYKNPGKPKKYKAHRVILDEREEITPEVIERLIKEGANVNTDNNRIFHSATANGCLKLVKLLLKHGANVHTDTDFGLRYAAENGHLEIVRILLKHGADVHIKNDTALRWAAAEGHLEVVKLLLEYGADVHADYALDWAAMNGYSEIVELLKTYM